MSVAAAIRATNEPDQKVDPTISPEDGMKPRDGDPEKYLKVGRTAATTLNAAVALAERQEISTILDYGCGHGRVVRWLHAFYPEATVYGADIKENGINFCHDTFGTVPVLCDVPFKDMKFDTTFDLIWLGSIYTHINQVGWRDLTKMLTDHLNPGGLLCFSFAGDFVYRIYKEGRMERLRASEQPMVEKMVHDYEADGFGFFGRDYETTDIWGRSIARLDWITNFVHRHKLKVVSYSEQRYGNRQDILCLQRRG